VKIGFIFAVVVIFGNMFSMAARIYESTSAAELEHSAHNLIASWDTLVIAGCKCKQNN
jgi:hypothetical protein